MRRFAIAVLLCATPAAGESLNVPRAQHIAITLPDGRVMVLGGFNTTEIALATTEIYDPGTKRWTAGPSLAHARTEFAAVVVRGRVLLVGGQDFEPATNTWSAAPTLALDPVAGTWTRLAEPATPRGSHTATVTTDGRVVITNGNTSADTKDGWPIDMNPVDVTVLPLPAVYNPKADVWVVTKPMHRPRLGHAAVALPGGRVAVIGGLSVDFKTTIDGATTIRRETLDLLDTIEVLDAGVWTIGARLVAARTGATATVLRDGRILVVGGMAKSTLASAELCDLTANKCSRTGSLATPRVSHAAVLLPSGEVAVIGGQNDRAGVIGSFEIYDPMTGRWRTGGNLAHARREHTATLLADGSILIAGGQGCAVCAATRADVEVVPITAHVELVRP